MKSHYFYVIITLAIMLPLFNNEHLFALDLVSTPSFDVKAVFTHGYPFRVILYALDAIMPSTFVLPVVLTSALFIAGMGADKLTRSLVSSDTKNRASTNISFFFAGALYMYNPFIYTRLLTGQYLIILGYSLMPWILYALKRLLDDSSLKKTLVLAGLVILSSSFSLHMLLISAAPAAAMLYTYGREKGYKKILRRLGIATALVLVACSYWIIPMLTGSSPTAETIASFSESDQAAYRTEAGSLGLTFNVLTMQGFWGDSQNLYLLPQDFFVWWWAPFVVLWGIVAYGIYTSWRQRRDTCILFLAIGICGFALAVGDSGTIFAPVNDWLYNHVPFFAGFREPQKFVALLVLAYTYFSAISLAEINNTLKNSKHRSLLWLALALPFFCAPFLLWGGAGQLSTGDYPSGWYAANEYLEENNRTNSKTLFLPWHLYMPYTFANNTVIANPAPKFFDIPAIYSQNPELDGAHGYYVDESGQKFESDILPNLESDSQLNKKLTSLGIELIILVKEYDYENYLHLGNKSGITAIVSNDDIIIYEVTRN